MNKFYCYLFRCQTVGHISTSVRLQHDLQLALTQVFKQASKCECIFQWELAAQHYSESLFSKPRKKPAFSAYFGRLHTQKLQIKKIPPLFLQSFQLMCNQQSTFKRTSGLAYLLIRWKWINLWGFKTLYISK